MVEVIKVGTKFGIDIVGTEFSIDIAEKFTPVTSGNKIVLTFKITDVYTMLRITDNDLAQSFLCQIVPKDYSLADCAHTLWTSIRKPFDEKNEKHGSIHEKTKTFKCVICDYSCYLKANLKRHIVSVHEKRKTFKCVICDYSCSFKANLKRHIESVHEERRPFKCDICDCRYSQKVYLKRHVQSVHEERKPFKCDIDVSDNSNSSFVMTSESEYLVAEPKNKYGLESETREKEHDYQIPLEHRKIKSATDIEDDVASSDTVGLWH